MSATGPTSVLDRRDAPPPDSPRDFAPDPGEPPAEGWEFSDPDWFEPTAEDWAEVDLHNAAVGEVREDSRQRGDLAHATQTDHAYTAYIRRSGRSTVIKNRPKQPKRKEPDAAPKDELEALADQERYARAVAERRQRLNGDYAVENELTTSIVLTMAGDNPSWDHLDHQVRLFMARLGRRCYGGRAYPYVKSLHEGVTTGRRHGHAQVPGYLSEEEVQSVWGEDRGLVFIEHLDNSVSVRAVAKYISREQPNWPEDKRYCQQAQGEAFRVQVEQVGVDSKSAGLTEARAYQAGREADSVHPFFGSVVARWEHEFRSPADMGSDDP